MQIDPTVLLTILGMALVTYGTRVGGLWLMDRVTLSKRMEAWLSYIPGTVLIAIIAPEIIKGGPIGALAALATALVAARSGNLLLAMIVGVGLVWSLRTLLGWV
ncbi:MAG: AzlD domain-containing protein [Chloroflexota bacterium]